MSKTPYVLPMTATKQIALPLNRFTAVPPDDLFICLRPVLAIGTCIGSFPLSGVLRLNADKLPTFRRTDCILFVISLLVVVSRLLLYIVLTIKTLCGDGRHMPLTLMRKISAFYGITINDAILCMRLLYLLWNAKSFCSMFAAWREVCTRLHFRQHDTKLRKIAVIILTGLLTSIISENWFNTVRLVEHERSQRGKHLSFLEAWYYAENPMASKYLPYEPITAALMVFVSKYLLYTNNLITVVAIVIAMALAQKFHFLVDRLAKETSRVKWTAARHDYIALYDLVEVVNRNMGIHIAGSTFFDFFYVVLLVYMVVKPHGKTTVDGVYGIWGMIHLLARFLLLCIPAGSLHSVWKRFWILIQKCPERDYNMEVKRFERLVAVPVGLTGMGLFTLRFPIILAFFNGVFTICIVLLQISTSP